MMKTQLSTSPDTSDVPAQLTAFLATVFGYCEGYVAVRLLREAGVPDGPPKLKYLPLNETVPEALAGLIEPAARDMRGLYVVPCTVREPSNAKAENIFQTCVVPCDLDRGDISAKQAHLERHLGPPTLAVFSGGTTEQGQKKRHLYWRLTEACSGPDLEKVIRIRSRIVSSVEADSAFERLTQPIRVAGSVHGKNGVKSPVVIAAKSDREYDLDELLESAENLPALPDLALQLADNVSTKPKTSFAKRQTTIVHAGAVDEENRFEAISRTIGHWIRQARLGHSTVEDARSAVSDYNTSMVRPPWSVDRLSREFDALLKLDRKSYPEAWLRILQQNTEAGLPVAAPDQSEDYLAETFVQKRGNDWRHVAAWGQWFHWTGTNWEVDETQYLLDQVRHVCRDSAHDLKPNEARRVASVRTIKAVERIASSDRRIATGTLDWDAHPHLLNTPSGTLDLETGEIGDAQREHHLTQITSASSGSIPEIWTSFIEQITGGDAALAAYLARVCGYCLTGDTREQAFFFFHGEGGNGKSVFIQTVANALGSYAATAPLDSFTTSRNTSHPTDLAGLRGKRLVTVTETEQGRAWAESRIKTITGGDPIRARLLYHDFFEFTPTFKLVVVGNHRPQLSSVGPAMRRRLQLVPFTVTFPEDQRDKALADRLEGVLGGVLSWMLAGYRDWKQKGLAPPESVTRASEEYFRDEDLIGQWLSENCEIGQQFSAPAKSLFQSWSEYADASGIERGSQKLFGEAMRSRNFVSRHTRAGNIWQGLALRRRFADGADQ